MPFILNRSVPIGLLTALGCFTTAALLVGMTPSPLSGPGGQIPVTGTTSGGIAQVTEFPLAWPKGVASTHEVTYDRNGGSLFWVTGQTHDALARVTLDGKPTFFALPSGSGPHGVEFDQDHNLWVTLEFSGLVVLIDQDTGAILKKIDVSLHAEGSPAPINTHPHGLGVAPDGKTLWFTGKATGTVGRIDSDGSVHHFALPTTGSVPIYIVAGPDGNMWCTELVGNQIARITSGGQVTEYPIPTTNSRPIAVTPAPGGRYVWFSEEAGNKVGRVDTTLLPTAPGAIVEYPVPRLHSNTILAALTFDRDGNLWTQAYIDPNNAYPAGNDAIVKIDRAILNAPAGDLTSVPITYYPVPTLDTVMHRITQGPDGALWFTELHADKLGRLEFIDAATAAKRPRPALLKAIDANTPRIIRPKPEFCG